METLTDSAMRLVTQEARERRITCETFEGLCNRMNGIVSAFATGRPILLRWAVNRQCPVPFEEVFAETFGAEVVNETVEEYAYARTQERFCWFYPQNIGGLPFGVFKHRVLEAYRRLLRSMRVATWAIPKSPALGLAYRHHLCDTDRLEHYWNCVEAVINNLRPAGVHVATDSAAIKQEFTARLEPLGVCVSLNDCPLLTHDYDRSPANVLGMCADLKSLACCRLGIVSNSTRSTVPDSLRGFGIQSYFTMDDMRHRHNGRDHFFTASPVECLIATMPLEPS